MKEKTLPRTVGIITAAGSGARMGAAVAKQFLDLEGRPLLAVTLEKFQACPDIQGIILVVPAEAVDFCRNDLVSRYGLTKVKKIIPGGSRRQDSVRLGIEASRGEYELVAIHDGVRPFVTPAMISSAVAAALQYGAATTALQAKETVKEVDGDGWIRKTYDRERVRLIQTPQVFRYGDILKAHQRALREGWEDLTDDALLMERIGIPVRVVEGAEDNIKVTTPLDLALARFLLREHHAGVLQNE